MRKMLNYYKGFVANKSVIRYDDILYLFHGAFVSPKSKKIKLVVSNLYNDKMRFIHNKDLNKVFLEYNLKD